METKILTLLGLMILIGCGESGSNNAGSDDSVQAVSTPVEGSNNDVSEFEGQTGVNVQAYLVRPDDDAPSCEIEDAGALIYMVEDKSFYYCDVDLGWVSIDLKGKDGRDGAVGKAGKDGRDGKDGKDGLNGRDGRDGLAGSDGQDGDVSSNSVWRHPVTGVKYFLVREAVYLESSTEKYSPCPEGSELPGGGYETWKELRGIFQATSKVACYDYEWIESSSSFRAYCKTSNGGTHAWSTTVNSGTAWRMVPEAWICKVTQ